MNGVQNKLIGVSTEANPDMGKEAYSNFASLKSNNSDCLLDFSFLDAQSPDESKASVLVSRIIMRNDRLINLRDAMDRQIISNLDINGAYDER